MPAQLAKIDRNAKVAGIAPSIANWGSSRNNKISRILMEKTIGIDKQVELPKFAKKTFIRLSKDEKMLPNNTAPGFGKKVALFATCYVNYNNTEVGVAAQKVLLNNNITVQEAYPGCCGMPFLEQAELDKVKSQSEIVSDELCKYIDEGYDIVTLTASCGLMLKFEWPLLLPDDKKFNFIKKWLCLTLISIIDRTCKKRRLKRKSNRIHGGVTVHNACHARAQNMGIKSRDMLKLFLILKWMLLKDVQVMEVHSVS